MKCVLLFLAFIAAFAYARRQRNPDNTPQPKGSGGDCVKCKTADGQIKEVPAHLLQQGGNSNQGNTNNNNNQGNINNNNQGNMNNNNQGNTNNNNNQGNINNNNQGNMNNNNQGNTNNNNNQGNINNNNRGNINNNNQGNTNNNNNQGNVEGRVVHTGDFQPAPPHVVNVAQPNGNGLLVKEGHGTKVVEVTDQLGLRYIRPVETEHVPCHHLLRNHIDRRPFGRKYRTSYHDPDFEEELPTDCPSIFQRNNFHTRALSKEEEEYPLAYARNVYKDYRFIEMELSTNYAPQNLYCFGVDGKSDALFQLRMINLTKCFNNVFLTEERFVMDSLGHNTNYFHLECLKKIRETQKPYKYAFLLQNHDIQMHTNQEMVYILKNFQGANDVTTHPTKPARKFKWDFDFFKLFKNKARNHQMYNNFEPELVPTRGFVQATLTRDAVDFILQQLSLDRVIERFTYYPKNKAEYLISSINNNDNVMLPGGFTSHCLNATTVGVTRFNVWERNASLCDSKIFRHGLCIFGLEDIVPKLASNPFLFANKMMPEFDFSAIACWHEILFNRTHHARGTDRVRRDFYWKLPGVRFRADAAMMGDQFDSSTFNCSAYVHEKVGTNIQEDNLRLIE